MKKLSKNFTNLLEAEKIAKTLIRKGTFYWLFSGAENNFTTSQNIEFLKKIKIYPQILSKVGKPDLSIDFFGKKIKSPIFLCPMGHQTQFHSKGELATAKGISDKVI